MLAIEARNASLKGVLPKDYARPALNKVMLGELIDLVSGIGMAEEADRSRDILGRVYEYFLGGFAGAEGKRGGEFYTPRSVVRLLVEMLEPYKGRAYDPCCGSGGMFVQSEKFVEEHGGHIGDIAIYGQESNYTTWRLAKMNLAVRGIDADIRWNNEGKDWMQQELSVGTIKNRMAVLRWWAQKADKQNVVARSNAYYGIPDRQFVTNTSKAKTLSAPDLEKICDPYVRMSLELQQLFGLRREEAIKFKPDCADRGDHITLKATWTKGGKQRDVPVRTHAQRDVLNRARQLVGDGSLIQNNRNYVQQLRAYERHTANAGLSKMHGLRHAYAQRRYQELTGWQAPAAGGPVTKALSPGQKVLDRHARQQISQELGHDREQITSVYLGR